LRLIGTGSGFAGACPRPYPSPASQIIVTLTTGLISTVKPTAMVMDAIKDVTAMDGIVLDPFGGSGSTLLAAEGCSRSARLIELDPRYCDLIVSRFQANSGEDARLEATGERFSLVREIRLDWEDEE
jgi:DNA modification methylase